MKKDSKPNIEKFLNDESFRNWAKESNQNDMAFWNNWINQNPSQIDDIYTVKAMILGITFRSKPVSGKKVNDQLDIVLNHISKTESKKTETKDNSLKKNFQKITSIAAVGLLFLFIGLNLYNSSKEIVHKTAYGEIIDLKLPDGTNVVLNGNSEIRYNKAEPRNVTLQGEGYFKVKSMLSTKAKFWVNTDDLTVEVYGTEFNVSTREDKTNVILDEGSIQLLLKTGISKKMVPGEFVSFSNENNIISHEKVNKDLSYSSWKEGTYIFNNTTLEDVMKHIEYTYGLTSEFINDELKQKTISGGVPNENIDICLSAIQKSTGIKIVKENTKLLIYH